MRLIRERRIPASELTPSGWAAGAPQLLGALRGRVVLLDIFSYADPAGVAALPHVRLLHDHYRESGLSVIGVHVPAYPFERSLADARQEIWRLGLPYPVALDQDFSVFRAYESRDLPARFVIDAQGYVRGWSHGPGGLMEAERAVRALLREASPGRELPHVVELPAGMMRPGGLLWMASPEIRFGTRGSGFGPPETDDPPPQPGESRDFGELPELRAQGRAYLQGRWTIHDTRITAEPGAVLSVVFEGASAQAVVSVEADGTESALEVTLDGAAPHAEAAGKDLETDGEGHAFLPLGPGRLYDLLSAAEFGVHNLSLRVRGHGVSFHLLHFGSSEVPEEA
ncbi:MAG TPA: redoxin domain-containing protein [bacterium]|nr:redoxin domain-containing protein [bacterium]